MSRMSRMSRMFFLVMIFGLLLVGCSRELNRVGAEPENVVAAPEPWLDSGDCSRNFSASIGSAVEIKPVVSDYGIKITNNQPYRLKEGGVLPVDCVYTQQTHIARDAWGNIAEYYPVGSWGTYYTKKGTIEHSAAQVLPGGLVLPNGVGSVQADGTLMHSVLFSSYQEVIAITWSVTHKPYDELLEIHVHSVSRYVYLSDNSPYIVTDKVPIYGGVIEVIKYP